MPKQESKISIWFNEIQHGNKQAFDELFHYYYPRLVAFAKSYTRQAESAEELTAELFVKLWLKRHTLPAILNPEVYLYRAVKNASLNLIRANKKRKQLFAATGENEATELAVVHDQVLEDKELKQLLDQAVSSLPEQRRIIFRLIKEDGLKPLAVAQILGISKRTVENQLYRAVKILGDTIEAYLGYDPQSKVKRHLQDRLSLLFF